MFNIEAIIAGVIAGIISGMGLGGGSLLLIYLTAIKGMPQLPAQNLNLLFFFPTAMSSLFVHLKSRMIDRKLMAFVAFPGILGAVAGGYIAQSIDSAYLRKGFGILLLYIGITELFRKTDERKKV
jgi:uncharacterized membrane protein YfcA